MSEELNLKDLKRVWNSQSIEKKYSTNEIFNILKRKSITSVKWVFIISLIELLCAILLYLYMFMKVNIEEFHEQLINNIGNWAFAYEFITFVVYGVTFLFIYKFFISYREIKVHSSIKDLSLDIIKFRKVVNYFIYFNLLMLLFVYIILIVPMIEKYPELQNMDWTSSTGLGIIAGITFIFVFFLGLVWLYYYVVYGTFQRRLKRNLQNLTSIKD